MCVENYFASFFLGKSFGTANCTGGRRERAPDITWTIISNTPKEHKEETYTRWSWTFFLIGNRAVSEIKHNSFQTKFVPSGKCSINLKRVEEKQANPLPSPSPLFLSGPSFPISESFIFGSLEDIFLKLWEGRGEGTKGTGCRGPHAHKILGRGLTSPHMSPYPCKAS